MNPKGELIALNLTNILNTDSEVNLLSSATGVNNSAFDTYYNVGFLDIFPDVVFDLSYTLNGTPATYSVAGGSGINDIDELILDLNSGLGSYALFSYEVSSIPSNYTLIIKILNSNFVPTQLVQDTASPCPNCIAHDVVIGTQTWAGCNANVSTYANGDLIPQVTDPTAWSGLTTGAWCYYNNDPLNEPIYGKLYNWYAVNDPRGLAPTGYHVPSDGEFTILTTFLGGDTVAGGKMKEVGLCHWSVPNTDATDISGFTSLPSGARYFTDGSFYNINNYGFWWTSTEGGYTFSAFIRRMDYDNGNTFRVDYNKKDGYSVRFIKD